MVAFPRNTKYSHSLSDLLGEWSTYPAFRHVTEMEMIMAVEDWGTDKWLQDYGHYSCVEMLKKDINFRVRESDEAPVGKCFCPSNATLHLSVAHGVSCLTCDTVTLRSIEQCWNDESARRGKKSPFYPGMIREMRSKHSMQLLPGEIAPIIRVFSAMAFGGVIEYMIPLCKRCSHKFSDFCSAHSDLDASEDDLGTLWIASKVATESRKITRQNRNAA